MAKKITVTTAGGGMATATPTNVEALRRATMASLLWENVAYESGVSISERLSNLVKVTPDADVAQIAIDARNMNVSSEERGIGYQSGWTTITGFSENVFEYIRQNEGL